jgi:hypothetical protein
MLLYLLDKFSFVNVYEGTSQNWQKSLFCLDFYHQNLIQSAATSKWIEIESKAFQRWLHITLGSTWGNF